LFFEKFGLIFFAAIAGATISVWRTRELFYWQDDFVFLRLAKESPFSMELLIRPLFTHFSPVSWIFHSILSSLNSSVIAMHAIVLMVLILGGFSLAALSLELGSNRTSAAFIAFFWTSSVIHIRSTGWWSAFVQTQPCSSFLFSTLASGLAYKRTANKKFLYIAYVGSLLTGLSYEYGYLAFVPMLILFTLKSSKNDPKVGLQLKYLFIFTLFFNLFLIALGKFKFTGPTGEFVLVTFMKMVATFIVVNISTLFGLTINSTKTESSVNLVGLILCCASIVFLIVLWKIKKNDPLKTLTLVILILSYLYSPFLIAYGRGQFESIDGIPKYPTDLQYHSLSFGFLLLIFVLIIEKHGNEMKKILAGFSLLLFLINLTISQNTYSTLVNRIGGIDSASAIKKTILDMPVNSYPINSFVPFVLPQFGEYGSLQSVAPILGIGKSIGAGNYPYIIDDYGVARPFSGRSVQFTFGGEVDSESKNCGIVNQQMYLDINLMSSPNTSEYLVLNFQSIISSVSKYDVTLIYADQEFPMGSYPTEAQSMGLQLPKRYVNRDEISNQPLKIFRVLGLSPGSVVCVASMEFSK
jgi:hypothetical protein